MHGTAFVIVLTYVAVGVYLLQVHENVGLSC